MTSRTCQLALGTKDNDVYNTNINFLCEVIDIFTQLEIGKGIFKPVQRGIIITTRVSVDITAVRLITADFH